MSDYACKDEYKDPMDFIKQTRKSRSVKRFAGQQFVDPQNIAEHQYATASLYIRLGFDWGFPMHTGSIAFVLNHDLLETESGDLLYPAKHMGENQAYWDMIEKEITENHPVLKGYTDISGNFIMTPEEWWLFKFCDAVEGYITSMEQIHINRLNAPQSCVRVYQKVLNDLIQDGVTVLSTEQYNKAYSFVNERLSEVNW